MAEDNKIALLIDCDNVSHRSVEGVIDELSTYGKVNIRNAYGNWKSENMRGWEEKLHPHAIKPIQQFAYTTGKNATDAAMIIDAMDLLYTETMDGFCVVSSDSDFTRLSARIREAGLIVYGFGEQKTPKAFVGACDRFIFTEILRQEDEKAEATKKPMTAREMKSDSRLVNLLRNATEDSADETGWANLGTVGQNIANKAPEFDPRNYGYKKLGELVTAIDLFHIDERSTVNSAGKQIYIRDKRRK